MKRPRVVGIIPVRMASTRFPGKPLAKIHGMTMVEHVYRRACKSEALDEVVVATCDESIRNVVEAFGGRAIMTADTHERGTDRVAEAARGIAADIIVNVQGDEPMIQPSMLDAVVEPLLRDASVSCCNLVSRLPPDENSISNPNAVKALVDLNMNALCFTRAVVPDLRRAPAPFARYQQLGIYALRRETLHAFATLSPTPLEIAESVDMMRLLEHGHPIRCAVSPFDTIPVDTPADLREVQSRLLNDPLLREYLPAKGATA